QSTGRRDDPLAGTVVGQQRAATSAGQAFAAPETHYCNRALTSGWPVAHGATERLSRILDHDRTVRCRQPIDLVQIDRASVKMRHDDSRRPLTHCRLELLQIR